ncbi:hypothetical protein HZS_1774 [Henneguya salminicola]|nr:hypothetical protein HZS_1774 [Henneguya salminicola]
MNILYFSIFFHRQDMSYSNQHFLWGVHCLPLVLSYFGKTLLISECCIAGVLPYNDHITSFSSKYEILSKGFEFEIHQQIKLKLGLK